MAHKKAAGKLNIQTRTPGKRLGIKVSHGETVNSGEVLMRQRGTKFGAGKNVKVGRDHTLYSVLAGTIKIEKRTGKNLISVVPAE